MPARKTTQARSAAEKSSAVEKALSIIEAVAGADSPVNMSEIERTTGLSRPTAHRVTASLIELGYIERHEDQRSHGEGPRLIDLALDVMRSYGPRTRRTGILAALADETRETCHFTMLRGHQLMLVDHVGAPVPLGVRYDGLPVLPAHCTAGGKLLLALLGDSRREAMLALHPPVRMTDRTLHDRRKLQAALEEIKSKRFAVEDGEHIDGVVGVAVPVELDGGKVIGALGLSAPASRLAAGDCMRLVSPLKAAAVRLAATFTPRAS